jgi:transposase
MQHQRGTSRNQIQFISLEDRIASDNPVRVIDAFAESLPLKEMGFKNVSVKSEGRPPYPPSVMLKLYLYGYSGGVRMRSSRRLEAESKRNVELMWLIEEMSPSHMSIAAFRSGHAKELKGVFKRFGLFLKGMELIGAETVAIDSTKIRGVNSKGNNYTEKEVKEYLEYLNEKSDSYLKELDAMDKEETSVDCSLSVKQEEVKGLLDQLKEKQKKYKDLQLQMKEQKATQISTTDADTKLMQSADGGNIVGFNIQTATDAKHSLIADFEVTNEGDRHALLAVGRSAKETLEAESLMVIADKGYHSGTELAACEEAGIVALVAAQQYFIPRAVPDERYNKEHFIYDNEQDTYSCPEGHKMVSNGTRLRRDKLLGKEETEVFFKDYKTTKCSTCPVRNLCTTAVKGRVISRFEYQDAVDANNKRVKDNPEVYARRKCIAEHPYGTIKRSWGYTYTLLKGIKKAGAEMSLIFTCYNIRRAISILGVVGLVEALNNQKMRLAA